MEREIKQLREEVEKIKERNRRVESDKGWETSKTRTAFIAISTFLLAYGFMLLINEKQPLAKAFAGTVAYIMSTASYGVLKSWWLERRKAEQFLI